jgi:hypothetical protein
LLQISNYPSCNNLTNITKLVKLSVLTFISQVSCSLEDARSPIEERETVIPSMCARNPESEQPFSVME